MRIPSHHNQRRALDNETMTPMIDVVFLLLVFFVCASVGQRPDQLLPASLNSGTSEAAAVLPEPAEKSIWDAQQVRIQLSPDPADRGAVEIMLNEQPVPNIEQLEQRLKRLAEIDAASPIILDVADSVHVQHFIRIYDLCQMLQFETIAFATRLKEPQQQPGLR